jgi:tetratricopeptide (TPR) repeat protein
MSGAASRHEEVRAEADDNEATTTEERLASWRRRLQDPSLVRRFLSQQQNESKYDEKIRFELDCPVPWQWQDQGVLRSSGEVGGKDNNRTDGAKDAAVLSYPQTDYLTIRRQQNDRFCQECLGQGVAAARDGKLTQADDYYQQGLELQPQHVDLLVAYGASLANQQNYTKAVEQLERATSLDPQEQSNAATYLSQVRQAMTRRPKVVKSVAARQDVLLEQSLQQNNRSNGAVPATVTTTTAAHTSQLSQQGPTTYELLPSEEDDDHDEDSGRRRKDRKSKKRRKHRKERRRVDSDDEALSSSDESSRQRRRRKRRKRKKKQRKRAEKDPSLSSSPLSTTDTVDSLKLQRRRENGHVEAGEDGEGSNGLKG